VAQVKIMMEGMSCMHCVGRVKPALDALDGVSESNVEIGSAAVTFDESKVSQADIEAAIEKSGYKIKK
jgi:copper ion binding protein